MTDRIKLEESWKAALAPEFETARMQALRRFLVAEKAAGKTIFPQSTDWFRALDLTPLPKVRVVILG
ncbi:MAG: uracil-DNA glycosylase, partial [Sphingomonadaceae bacterium]|nr:uracil-DNA glycosylase [Sphingomonadaceae bacterium]